MTITRTGVRQLWRLTAVALLTLSLAACGGGGGSDSSSNGGTTTPVGTGIDGQADVAASGGTVAITDANSPIRGAKVVMGAATLDGAERIQISHEDALPAPFNAQALALGAKAISKTVVLTRSGTSDFGQAVAVTVPYDKAALSADAVPIVVHWDTAAQSYTPVTIRKVDRTAGTVTFMTAHFSKYVVMVLDRLFDTVPPTAALGTSTGFSPAVDGFFMRNFGSYNTPGGNCFGMAGYAAWYYASKKASRGAGLYSLYRQGDSQMEEDDQVARELVVRAFKAGEQKGHIEAMNWVSDQGFLTAHLAQRFTAYSLIQQLIVTRQPQILGLGAGTFFSWSSGHAVTVYAYDDTKKVFRLYDNNFPAEVIELPWDPLSGFGAYPKNVSYDLYAFASFNQAYSPATLEGIYTGSEAGWPETFFPKITLTVPTELAAKPGTFEVASADNVKITGSVPRSSAGAAAANPTAQRYVHLYLNGQSSGAATAIDNTRNTFDITIPKLPVAAGTEVMLIVSQSPDRWRGVFTSFKAFKVRVAGQYFFQNMGFETGAFSAWASERHLWGQQPGVITPSDKSNVMGSGTFDPYATDLPVSLFGKYAARVNNSDNSEHISSLRQTAVVPSGGNPTVRFYWAAVLEDPDHDPADQPYVDVTVRNLSKGSDLYKKRYYSNDPSYSGWKSYRSGSWKAIPWQLVDIPVAAHVGDSLEIVVEAADCALGGHGGYVYLDAEE